MDNYIVVEISKKRKANLKIRKKIKIPKTIIYHEL